MSSVEYIFDSDILESNAQLIAHQCCCVSTFKGKGKGLYESIANKFPYANVYSSREEDSLPGTVKLFGDKKLKQRLVLAIFAQLKPGPPSKKDTTEMRERWFSNALKKISNIKGIKSIAFPYKIGCGLAQGNWEVYRVKIEEWAKSNPSIDVYIVSNCPDPSIDSQTDSELLEEDSEEEHVVPITSPNLKFSVDTVSELDESENTDSDDEPISKKESPKIKYETPIKKESIDYSTNEEFLVWLWKYIENIEFIDKSYFINLYEKSKNIGGSSSIVTNSIATYTTTTTKSYTWKTATLLEYTLKNIPKTYEKFFEIMESGGCLQDISSFLEKESRVYDIYPPMDNIYKAFEFCDLDNLKVVAVGQDPYHTKGAAMGVAFGHLDGVKLQPSLRNIYKAVEKDGFKISTEGGDITKWCKQGVFFINTALTVRAGEAGSHTTKSKDGPWEYFIRQLFRFIDEKKEHLVVMLWGAAAQKYKDSFSSKHFIITTCHPAACAYNPSNTEFFDSLCFSKANRKLKTWGMTPIDWSLE